MEEVYVDARVESIEDVQFILYNEENLDLNNIFIDVSGGKFYVNMDEKTITFETGVKYSHKNSDGKYSDLLVYVNHFKFYVDNIFDIVKIDNNSPTIDKGIVKLFLEIVIPTIRGILTVKTLGTNIAKAYMPIYKVENLIK